MKGILWIPLIFKTEPYLQRQPSVSPLIIYPPYGPYVTALRHCFTFGNKFRMSLYLKILLKMLKQIKLHGPTCGVQEGLGYGVAVTMSAT